MPGMRTTAGLVFVHFVVLIAAQEGQLVLIAEGVGTGQEKLVLRQVLVLLWGVEGTS